MSSGGRPRKVEPYSYDVGNKRPAAHQGMTLVRCCGHALILFLCLLMHVLVVFYAWSSNVLMMFHLCLSDVLVMMM